MAVRIENGAEPLPGYRLIERLGGGGFGEVWKCEAPGGLHKAIKLVYGDLEAADNEDGARAGQELKALSRVKTVRHPYILSLERYDIVDGQLLIVMELADRSLWDRFRECRASGLPGIPRDELIRYLEETAEALDLMNSLYQLQHLDIKPQNLFLVHNHVKVADFGLVKDLEGATASVTGGVTPVYAAPETFDGRVSRFSDQYSLSIVYQELLTGQRPFTGGTLRQLVLQHLQAAPDLSSLSAADRAVVGRALAKMPDDRYPTCTDFVLALRAASRGAPTTTAAPDALAEFVPPPVPLPDAQLPPVADSEQKTQPGHRSAPPISSRSVEIALTPNLVVAPTPTDSTPPPSGAPPRPPALRPAAAYRPLPTRVESPTPVPGHRRAAVPESPGGVLLPAVAIGLGRMGLQVIRQLRQEIVQQYGSPDVVPHLRLLHIDTDPDTIGAAPRGQATALRPSETLLARLHRPSHYLKSREILSGLESWLNPKMLYRMSRHQTAAGHRALGRLAFVDNYRSILRRLEAELQECCRPEALQHAAQSTGLAPRSCGPRVYIVTSLAGGSGSGMLLDLAYTAGHVLQRLGHEQAEVVCVALLPPVDGDPAHTPDLANAFAALMELNHFAASDALFQACFDTGDPNHPKVFSRSGPPFQRCFLLGLPEVRAGATPMAEPDGDLPSLPRPTARILAQAGHFLFADLLTPLGRMADQCRRETAEKHASGMLAQTFGLYRILWPKQRVLERAARSVCRRLVQRWMTKDAKPLREPLRAWVQKQWDELGLSQEHLIQRLQKGCEQTLKQTPETALGAVLSAAQAALLPQGGRGDGSLKVSAVIAALDQFEQILGVPEDCRKDGPRTGTAAHPPGTLEQALAETMAGVAQQYEQRLSELVVRLIEEPHYRLAGAEEALRQLNELVEQALHHHEELARELQERASALYQKIQHALGHPETKHSNSSGWKASRSRRGQPSNTAIVQEVLEALRSYAKCRYQSLVLQRVSGLYVGLRGQLSDQLREVDYCRARLSELSELLLANGPQADMATGPAAGRYLFPQGCQSVEDTMKRLEEAVGLEQMLELDRQIQALLRKQFRALVNVCMSPSNLLRTLTPAMLEETERFLEPLLGGADVAHMYLEQHQVQESKDESATDALRLDLLAAFHKAAPELRSSSEEPETFILGVPACLSGQEFRDLLRLSIPSLKPAAAPTADELVFYREQNCLALTELEQLGPAGLEAYRRVAAQEAFTPHARQDLTWRGTAADAQVSVKR